MTREEASYILRKFYADGYKSNNYNALEQALKLAVMCLENLPHWISVEFPRWISVHDKLPKDGQHAATINKVGVQDVRHYSHGKWYSNFGNEYDDITHWMPLPQAPKKGGDQ